MIFRLDSPGLLVKTYRQKFIEIMNSVKKIVINREVWFFGPRKNIENNPIDKHRKIIPISKNIGIRCSVGGN